MSGDALHLGIRTKLALGFGVLLAIVTLLGGYGYYSLSSISQAAAEANHSSAKEQLAAQLEIAARKQIQAANDHTFNGDAASLSRYRDSKEAVAQGLLALGRLLRSDDEKNLLAQLNRSAEHISSLTDLQIDLRRQSRTFEATDLAFGPKEEQAIRDIAQDAAQLESWEEQGAQKDLDAERAAERNAYRVTLSLVAFGLAAGLLTAALISRSITGGLARMLRMIEAIASKQLSVPDIPVSTRDDIGQACDALNTMKNNLRALIEAIASTAECVASTSEQISQQAGRSAVSARGQSAQTENVGKVIAAMVTAVQSVSDNSSNATESSEKAAEAARRGGKVIEQTLATIRGIADASKATALRVTALGENSARIATIVGVIQDIADQTNLLALNAAIEAARAGEQGRGFAVVADEVRKLAERTTQATQEISSTVESIQAETSAAVRAMEAGAQEVEVGVEKTSVSGATLQEIIDASAGVCDLIGQIANSTAEQLEAARQANTSLSEISSLTRESSASADETASACSELSKLASDLRGQVKQFQTAGSKSGGHAFEPEAGLGRASNPANRRTFAAGAGRG